MKQVKHIYFLGILVFFSSGLWSQKAIGNLKNIPILTIQDTSFQISEYHIPNTVKILPSIYEKYITIEIQSNQVFLHIDSTLHAKTDSIWVTYRVFPEELQQKYCLIDSSNIIRNDRAIDIAYDLRPEYQQEKAISSNNMDYRGSFSRGLAVGNSQDLVLNSNFDMSLQGDLGGGLMVKGVISDDNIPIQAEGNTQQLREFDKVFVEISKDDTYLRAGDYVLEQNQRYFSKYYKKLQGATLGHRTKWNDLSASGNVSYAISRGKFARQNLQVQDGNQGPYKLTGNDGERFLVVLSGTERVYIDGKLLKRGEQYDYTIDYNSAEVAFTINQIITQANRIIVEYEYTDQNFLRTVYAGDVQVENKKWLLGVNLYSEQDNTNVAGFADLDSTRLNILTNSGDQESESVVSGIFLPDLGLENIVFYTVEFDPVNNTNFLLYSPERVADVVGAEFSEVENNSGNYIIDEEIAINKRVYKYVGPNLGNYNPEIKLITPKQKQLVNLFTHFTPDQTSKIGVELALSKNDLNRFSILDSQDDTGAAIMVFANKNFNLGKLKKWNLNSEIKAEGAQNSFTSLNPYRAIEFNRIWSIGQEEEDFNEFLSTAKISLNYLNNYSSSYTLNNFIQQGQYRGIKHVFETKWQDTNWEIKGKIDWLKSAASKTNSTFYIPDFLISNKSGEDGWTYGIQYLQQRNERRLTLDNSLEELSSFYETMGAYFGKKINEKFDLTVIFNRRNDWGINANLSDFKHASEIDEYKLNLIWNHGQKSNLNLTTTYRTLEVTDQTITKAESNKGLFSRLNHKLRLWDGGIKTETLFESGSGQEPKQEYRYLMVQQGEGSYIWNDYNTDSLQQVNEFEIAPFSDQGNFERFVVFNNEFIRTSKTELKQLLDFKPSKILNLENKKWKWMEIFFWRSRYHLVKKTLGSGGNFLNFFNFNIEEEGVVSFKNNYDHTLYINQGSTLINGEISRRNNQNRIVLISGFEERQKEEWYARCRYNWNKILDLSLEAENGMRVSLAQNYAPKNYEIEYLGIKPKIVWRANKSIRWTMSFKYSDQKNLLGNETSTTQDFGTEFIWRKAQKSNLSANLNYVLNEYTGATGSPLELEMLQGLKAGNNWVWSLLYTRRIGKQIDANFSYNGRQSGSGRTVHTFSGQMKILF